MKQSEFAEKTLPPPTGFPRLSGTEAQNKRSRATEPRQKGLVGAARGQPQ